MLFEQSSLSPVFYISILFIIIAIGLVIFFIKKLKYNLNKILKSVGASLLITLSIEILLFIISIFLSQPVCKEGSCPSNADLLFAYLPYTSITIFLITILVYYIIKYTKK